MGNFSFSKMTWSFSESFKNVFSKFHKVSQSFKKFQRIFWNTVKWKIVKTRYLSFGHRFCLAFRILTWWAKFFSSSLPVLLLEESDIYVERRLFSYSLIIFWICFKIPGIIFDSFNTLQMLEIHVQCSLSLSLLLKFKVLWITKRYGYLACMKLQDS